MVLLSQILYCRGPIQSSSFSKNKYWSIFYSKNQKDASSLCPNFERTTKPSRKLRARSFRYFYTQSIYSPLYNYQLAQSYMLCLICAHINEVMKQGIGTEEGYMRSLFEENKKVFPQTSPSRRLAYSVILSDKTPGTIS